VRGLKWQEDIDLVAVDVLAAAGSEVDPDRRIVLMLGGRGTSVAPGIEQVGKAV
jgi:hypothetical protein